MQGKVLPEPNTMPAVYAGIDVCKEWLDADVPAHSTKFRVNNDRFGRRRLNRELAKLAVTQVVMEATGKYHRAAQRSLHAAGLLLLWSIRCGRGCSPRLAATWPRPTASMHGCWP